MSCGVLFIKQRKAERLKQREVFMEAFRKADKDGTGKLSAEEIYEIYVEHGVDCTLKDVQEMVKAADKDGSGRLNEKEFLECEALDVLLEEKPAPAAPAPATASHGSSHGKTGGETTKQAEIAFRLYDKDKDGYITKSEMEKLSKNLSKEQIDKVFARFDADGDGRLSYAEFRKMMNK